MHPVLSNLRKLNWAFFICVVAGCIFAALMVLAEFADWKNALLFCIPVSIMLGFLSSSAYYICRAAALRGHNFHSTALLFTSSSLISGLLFLGICQLWTALLTLFNWPAIRLNYQIEILLTCLGSLIYLLSIFAHEIVLAFENLSAAERRAAQAIVLVREAELQALRAQINPHFLFNSLNSISALTALDPAGARSMTLELAQFFRQTLQLSERKKIPFSEDLRLCQHFLAIEKIRFGKKLQVEFDLDTAAEHALIIPMLLQPLLENAIKHGIGNLLEGGTIQMRTLVRENWLHLSISNPCETEAYAAYEKPDTHINRFTNRGKTSGTGTGLKNIRQRLNSVYGEQARIRHETTQDQFTVELTIPLEFAD